MEATKKNVSRAKLVWESMPGTSRHLSRKSEVPISAVRALLREWQAAGLVEMHVRHIGRPAAYTRVYYRTKKDSTAGLL